MLQWLDALNLNIHLQLASRNYDHPRHVAVPSTDHLGLPLHLPGMPPPPPRKASQGTCRRSSAGRQACRGRLGGDSDRD